MSHESNFRRLKPEQRLGDAPIEEHYHAQMTVVMQVLDDFLNGGERPRKTGLVILMFPFGEVEGRCNFMSNGANRNDVVTLMKEMIARFEGQPEIKGRG